jgi:hypothetical protein
MATCPTPAGRVVRRRVAKGLEHAARVARRTLDLMSGEVAPDTGLLAAACGETHERIGLDSGLETMLTPLYEDVTEASLAFAVRIGRCCRHGWGSAGLRACTT